MAFWIQISPGSSEPIYQQIIEQIQQMIARGRLTTGQKLPAVRKLASELVVNPNTVARAYTMLEQSGLVTTKTGAGTFVSDPKLRGAGAVDLNAIAERMDSIIARGLSIGKSDNELIEMFKVRVASFVSNNNQN